MTNSGNASAKNMLKKSMNVVLLNYMRPKIPSPLTRSVLLSSFIFISLCLGCEAQEQTTPIPTIHFSKRGYPTPMSHKKLEPKNEHVAVWVNDEPIKESDILAELQQLEVFYNRQEKELDAKTFTRLKKEIEKTRIDQLLLRQYAKAKHVFISEGKARETMEQAVRTSFGSITAFHRHLEHKNSTTAQYLEKIRDVLILKKIFENIHIDKEIILRQFFNDFGEKPTQIKSQIRVFQSPQASPLPLFKYPHFRTEIRKKRILISAKFDLDWVRENAQGVPSHVFAANVNDVVPIEQKDTTFYYWIRRKRTVLNPRFLMVKQRLQASLKREKREKMRSVLLETLRKKAVIRYEKKQIPLPTKIDNSSPKAQKAPLKNLRKVKK